MPLSEHEQRILEEIERRLAAEDPKLARTVSLKKPPARPFRSLRGAIAGFAGGFALLIAGLFLPEALIVLGIAAFAVMLASVVAATGALKHMGANKGDGSRGSTWLSSLEQKWRKRLDRGDGTK